LKNCKEDYNIYMMILYFVLILNIIIILICNNYLFNIYSVLFNSNAECKTDISSEGKKLLEEANSQFPL